MAEIRMPKMGDGMEEGTILRWMKREGETVAAEEPIAEIETDKANVEIPAEEAGTLSRIVVHEGETVPVGAVIGYLGEAAAPVEKPGGTPQAEPVQDRTPTGEAGTSSADAYSPAPPPPSVSAQPAAPAPERVKASPLARRMADDLGVDLARVRGSGPGGRIVERDVTAFQEQAAAAPAAPAPRPLPAPSPTGAAAPFLAGRDEPVTRMRRAIARRTVQSKQTVPHFYITMPVEMDRALALLAEMNAQDPEGKVTVNDLVVKACAVALARLPDVNVSYTPNDAVRHYDTINISIAVPTDEGLTMPVITDCRGRTLRDISAAARALIAKARGGAITPQEMSGGTFSVTNMGMLGVEEFAAIINPPEAAILAVGAAMPEAVPQDDGTIVARRRMRVTLSCDHRAVDGLLGAKFVQEVKRLLESPLSLLA